MTFEGLMVFCHHRNLSVQSNAITVEKDPTFDLLGKPWRQYEIVGKEHNIVDANGNVRCHGVNWETLYRWAGAQQAAEWLATL